MARRASFSFFLVCLNKLLKTCLSNKPAVLLWEFVLQIFFLFSGSWNQQKPFRNYHWVAVLCFCSFSLVHGFMDFFTLCTWFVFVPDVYFPYTQVTHFFFLIYFYYLSKKETTSRESSSFTSQVFFLLTNLSATLLFSGEISAEFQPLLFHRICSRLLKCCPLFIGHELVEAYMKLSQLDCVEVILIVYDEFLIH